MSIETGIVWTEETEEIWVTAFAGVECSLHKGLKSFGLSGFEDGQDAKLFAEACLRLRMEVKGGPLQKVLGDVETADKVLALVERMGERDYEDFRKALENVRKR